MAIEDDKVYGLTGVQLKELPEKMEGIAGAAVNASVSKAGKTGSYNDLTDKPVIPEDAVLYSATGQNTDGAMTQKATTDALSGKADSSSLATVATSGAYGDLSGRPSIPTKTSDLTNDSNFVENTSLATVATTGSYSDLSDKPAIPTVPTNVSAFTNDSGYQTASQVSTAVGAETTARETAVSGLQSQIDGITASSDVTDIVGTKAALDAYDISKLHNNDIVKVLQDESQNGETTYYRWSTTGNAFTLIGEEGPYYTKSETDALLNAKANTSSLAAVATSGSYSDLSDKPTIPTTTSQLTNNSDFVSDSAYVHTDNNFTTTLKNKLDGVESGAEANVNADWNATSGDAEILNKPTIPTKVSQLTNDSGYQTATQVTTAVNGKQDKLVSGTNIKTINGASVLGTGDINAVEPIIVTLDTTNATWSSNVDYSDITEEILDGDGRPIILQISMPSLQTYYTAPVSARWVYTESPVLATVTMSHDNDRDPTPEVVVVQLFPNGSYSIDENDLGTITEVTVNGSSVGYSGVVNIPSATTSRYGATKLSTSTSSTSTTLAATASALKSAYDLANTANTTAASKSTVSFSRSLTSGTKVGTLTIDGTATDLYAPTDTNTDTKVTQTVRTTNGSFPILLRGDSAGTTTATTTTSFGTKITANPSTGKIVATSGSIASGDTALVTGGTVYTSLAAEPDVLYGTSAPGSSTGKNGDIYVVYS